MNTNTRSNQTIGTVSLLVNQLRGQGMSDADIAAKLEEYGYDVDRSMQYSFPISITIGNTTHRIP